MLEAPFRLARRVLPHMYEHGWGRVVNVSSVHGVRASPFKSAYVSAKHGLEGLSKVIALEGAAHGVTSNCLNPGYVRTPLVERQIADQARTHGIDGVAGPRADHAHARGREAARRTRRGRRARRRALRPGVRLDHRRPPTSWTAVGPPTSEKGLPHGRSRRTRPRSSIVKVVGAPAWPAPPSSGTTSSSTASPRRSCSARSSSPAPTPPPACCCRWARSPSASSPGRSAAWSSATTATRSAARRCSSSAS